MRLLICQIATLTKALTGSCLVSGCAAINRTKSVNARARERNGDQRYGPMPSDVLFAFITRHLPGGPNTALNRAICSNRVEMQCDNAVVQDVTVTFLLTQLHFYELQM